MRARVLSPLLGPLLGLGAAVAGAGIAQAQGLPVGETTYIEHSLNRDGTLVIEHPPVATNPYGRRGGDAAIAGFCRDGGYVRRLDAFGNPTIVRQREVCDSVAPRTLMPGEVEPRPVWPAERVQVLRSKG